MGVLTAFSNDHKHKLTSHHFRPRCPQVPVDVRDLMQIPRSLKLYDRVPVDELECLNLNITAPADVKPGSLPVVVWIHGGAQLNSWPAADERLGGTSVFVTFVHHLLTFLQILESSSLNPLPATSPSCL